MDPTNTSMTTFLMLLMVILMAIITIHVSGYVRRSTETAQVTIVRKFDACFVIYKDDIESFPCPAPERQWVKP
jgi:hypothetical protein